MFVQFRIDFTQKATKTIKVEIIDGATPVHLQGHYQGQQRIRISSGITLIETSSGTYSGITSGGNAVTTSNLMDGL